jgi:hypothetical protein
MQVEANMVEYMLRCFTAHCLIIYCIGQINSEKGYVTSL